jgi:predicted nucleic acid-binding protein
LSRSWVVDASVGIKLYLPEDLSEVASRLFEGLNRGRHLLFVPDLFFTECANILWKNVLRLRVTAVQARSSLRGLALLPLLPVFSTDLLLTALDLSLDRNISVYDACYAALAEELKLPLLTADQKLLRKLEHSGIDVRFLGDLSL